MNIGLIDVDSKIPNLALMKISAYHKSCGDSVELTSPLFAYQFDQVYASKIFHDSTLPMLPANAIIGGSGTGDYSVKLPDEIEHSCPDYGLYGIDYSMGFTSRGCIRDCSFCIVPAKEGKIVEWSPLSEFVRHKKVVVLDNNFLASWKWKEKISEMIEKKLVVDFNQGLDIRLLNEEKAQYLTELNPPYLRFAWDSMDLMRRVKSGVRLLRDAGYPINRNRVGFYVLTGHGTTPKQDLYRLDYLHRLNINTHVQPFIKNRENNRLSRWGNQPRIWTKTRFSQYTA